MIATSKWLVLAALAGCGVDTYITPDVLLADLDATLDLKRNGADLELVIASPGCSSLTSTVYAQLDGVSGVASHDARYTSNCDIESCEDICDPPNFTWTAPALAGNVATLIVTDSETTWTFTVDPPVERAFELAAPTDHVTLRAGELVTLRLTPPGGTMTNEVVVAHGDDPDTVLFSVQIGSELQFTIPPLAAPVSAKLDVSATFTPDLLTCDAPGGCNVPEQRVQTTLPLSLAP